jgi:hypothetical protein
MDLDNTWYVCIKFTTLHKKYPMWWPGLKNSPTVTHVCRKRRLKWVPSAWEYINTEILTSRLVVSRGLKIQPRKKIMVTKPQKGGPGPDLGCRAI